MSCCLKGLTMDPKIQELKLICFSNPDLLDSTETAITTGEVDDAKDQSDPGAQLVGLDRSWSSLVILVRSWSSTSRSSLILELKYSD